MLSEIISSHCSRQHKTRNWTFMPRRAATAEKQTGCNDTTEHRFFKDYTPYVITCPSAVLDNHTCPQKRCTETPPYNSPLILLGPSMYRRTHSYTSLKPWETSFLSSRACLSRISSKERLFDLGLVLATSWTRLMMVPSLLLRI